MVLLLLGLSLPKSTAAKPFLGSPFVLQEVGASPRSVVVADFDGDGFTDLASANHDASTLTVLFGSSSADFPARLDLATGAGPRAVVTRDLDGDGRKDLVSINATAGTVSVLRNLGGRQFGNHADIAVGGTPYAVAAGDLNGDGDPDLVVADNEMETVTVLLGSIGTGSGAPQVLAAPAGPTGAAIADFTGDGQADFVVVGNSASAVWLFAGDGSGGFGSHLSYATAAGPMGLAAGDVNGDGRTDLVVTAFGAGKICVFPGAGSGFGSRSDYACASQPYAVILADFDSDGDAEIAAASYSQDVVTILRNTGSGFASRQDFRTGSAPTALAAGMLDLDTRVDLVTACSGGDALAIHYGNGDRTFGGARTLLAGTTPRAVEFADLDGAGGIDMLVLSTTAGTVTPMLGTGEGSFAPLAPLVVGSDCARILAMDVNVDGKIDLVTLFRNANYAYVWSGNGQGGFSGYQYLGTGASPVDAVAVDLNFDGRLDLAIANAASGTVTLHFSTGSMLGSRADVTVGSGPSSLRVGDLDGDGRADLVVGLASTNTVAVLFGQGAGTFEGPVQVPVAGPAQSLALVDVDRDGWLDIAVACGSAHVVSLLRQGPGRTFTRSDLATTHGPVAVVATDLNGDSYPELVAACGEASNVALFTGAAGGAYPASSRALLGAGIQPVALATADLDGDGRPELAVANAGSDEVTLCPNLAARASAPVLLSPPDLAHVASIPTFAWRLVPDANAYQLVVARNPSLSSEITAVQQLPAGTASVPYTGEPLEPGADYWWSVRALVGGAWTPYAPPWRIHRAPGVAAVAAPVLFTPANDAPVSLPETFSWSTVSGAKSYRIWIADDAGFANVRWRSLPTSIPSATVTASCGALAVGQSYYWGATAVDVAGYEGPMSSPARRFTVTSLMDPPGAPVPLFPPQGAVLTSKDVNFQWEEVATASTYELTYSTSASFAPGSNTTWTVTGITGTSQLVTLASGSATLYWKVRARNSAGPGPDSPVRSFSYQYEAGQIARVTMVRPSGTVRIGKGASLTAKAFAIGRYTGTISGWWVVDNQPWKAFSASMTAAAGATIESSPEPIPYTSSPGTHTIYCRIDSPVSRFSDVATYVAESRPAGAAAALRIRLGQSTLVAGSGIGASLQVDVVDALGLLVTSDNSTNITLDVSGPASAAPSSGTTSSGQWWAMLQPGGSPGTATIQASAPLLPSETATVEVLDSNIDALREDALSALQELGNLRIELDPLFPATVKPGYRLDDAVAYVNGATVADTAGVARLAIAARALARIFYVESDRCQLQCTSEDNPGAATMLDDAVAQLQNMLGLAVGLAAEASGFLKNLPSLSQMIMKEWIQGAVKFGLAVVEKGIEYVLDHSGWSSEAQTTLKNVVKDLSITIKSALDVGDSLAEILTAPQLRYLPDAKLAGLLYVRLQTQGVLDQAIARSQQPPALSCASANAQVKQLQEQVRVETELRDGSVYAFELAGDILDLVSDISGCFKGTFATVIEAITKILSLASYLGALGESFTGFSEATDGALGTISAVYGPTPGSLAPPSRGDYVAESSQTFAPSRDLWTRLGLAQVSATATYGAQAQDMLQALANRDTLACADLLPGLLAAGEELGQSTELATSPVSAASASAMLTIDGFRENSDSLARAVRRSTFSRLKFAGAVLDYLAAPGDEIARRLAQDSGAEVLAHNTGAAQQLGSTVSALFVTPASPLLRSVRGALPDSVASGTNFQVTRTISNLGAGVSPAAFVRLSVDSLLELVSPDSIPLPALAPGDTALVSWTVHARPKPGALPGESWSAMLVCALRPEVGVPMNETELVSAYLPTSPAAVPGERTGQLLRISVYPNPASRQPAFAFTLPGGGSASVEVFDLFGRRVAVVASGTYVPGVHVVRWNPRGSAGEAVRSGLYIARLTQDGHSVATRFVLAP